MGRDFRRTDGDPGSDPVAIVSYAFWQKWMARDPQFSKTPITVGTRTYSVVGVMPPAVGGNVWVPMPHGMEERADSDHYGSTYVRLKSGVTSQQMTAQLARLAAVFVARYGAGSPPVIYRTRSLIEGPGVLTSFHTALGAAAFIVLLIACANVANLLVARVITRQRDIAVRMALGASQSDVARYVLGEAVVLSAAGAIVGVLLAVWGAYLIQYRLSVNVPQLGTLTPHLSWRVCVFALVVSVGTVAAIGWAAVRRARSTVVNDAMKEGSGFTTQRRGGVYRGLVVTEVALSLIVLMGAALCLRATRAVSRFNFGFDAEHLLLVIVHLPVTSVPKGGNADRAFDGLAAGVREVSGVRAVATKAGDKVAGDMVTSDVGGSAPRQLGLMSYSIVSPEYFTTMGIPISRGRDFQPGDAALDNGVAIVDDSVAAQLWPHESPVGHMLKLGDIDTDGSWVRVIGVARSVPAFDADDPDHPPQAAVYVARSGAAWSNGYFLTRSYSSSARRMMRVCVWHYIATCARWFLVAGWGRCNRCWPGSNSRCRCVDSCRSYSR